MPSEMKTAGELAREYEARLIARATEQLAAEVARLGRELDRLHSQDMPRATAELQAEITRLRAELEAAHRAHEDTGNGFAEELASERAAHEQTLAELARWREALGGDFGPQTPDAVPVFQREAERVQGQVAACEIAKARARVAELERQLSGACEGRGNLFTALQAAESALASARELLETASEPYDVAQWTRNRDAWLSAHPTPGAELVRKQHPGTGTPKCIRCLRWWVPEEGVDATLTPCSVCLAEADRDTARAIAGAAEARVAELQALVAELEVRVVADANVRRGYAQRAVAAESALASARRVLGRLEQRRELAGTTIGIELSKLLCEMDLAAHPTPGAEKGAGT